MGVDLAIPRPNPWGPDLKTDTTADEREQTYRAAFLALVETQDAGHTVRSSREHVARQFGLRVDQVVAIEREGIDNQWPPLGRDAV